MSHATVRPARLRFHSTDLSCQVIRTYGYRARCACGWEGPVRGKHRDSRQDGREHVCDTPDQQHP